MNNDLINKKEINISKKNNRRSILKLLIFCLVFYFILTFKLPFYIERPGGLIDLSSRVNFKEENNGSLNMVYIIEQRATIPSFLVGYLMNTWDIYPESAFIASNETYEELEFSSSIMLEESLSDSKISAFNLLGIDYEIANEKVFVSMVDEASDTDIRVGDRLVSVNGIKLLNSKHLKELTERFEIGTTIYFDVEDINKKEQKRTACFVSIDGLKLIGVVLSETKDVLFKDEFNIDFKDGESGPSGGMMMSLYIYNHFSDDLIKGRKIAGTGTINSFGYVGPIGGIKYKTITAAKEKVDVFFVPAGNNYENALKAKKEFKLKLNIVSVETLEDVITYLKNN